MRILGQLAILITVFVMLQACASTRIAQQLQSGKISFEDGNYKSAFHKLLPLASEGSAEAEYAVGYMYYYGYGTTQDSESGLFWMNKSAEQKYPPAIEALKIIKANKISEEPTQQLTAERSVKEDSDDVLKALAASQPGSTSSNADPEEATQLARLESSVKPRLLDPENNESSRPMTVANSMAGLSNRPDIEKTAADFNTEHNKKYTLQLMGSHELADIKRAQARLHIEDNSYCARTMRDGRDWYVLGYGKYPAPYLAKLAIDDLPQNLRAMNPWVRPLEGAKIVA